MSTIDPTNVAPSELTLMLRAGSRGVRPGEAAAGLLIAGEYWLRRRDFLARLVDVLDDRTTGHGMIRPAASIDWEAVPDFAERVPAPSGELAVLRFAASLAGTDTAPLRDLTASVDETAGRHLLDALAHRLGWHERGITHLVTGHQLGDATPAAAPAIARAPTFEDIRRNACYRLGDAADWLRTKHQPETAPSSDARDAVHRALTAIHAAKIALRDAGAAESRAAARHRMRARARQRAEADSAQYPDSGGG